MDQSLLPRTATKKARDLAVNVDQIFTNLGCNCYKKTIYLGYEYDGEMVAALYINRNYLEIPLALPEEYDGPLIEDARHLTWRTLPVAAVVKSKTDLNIFENYAREAFERVKNRSHTVLRDNQFFAKSRRERKGPGYSIKRQKNHGS
jgi:hypothetical protein